MEEAESGVWLVYTATVLPSSTTCSGTVAVIRVPSSASDTKFSDTEAHLSGYALAGCWRRRAGLTGIGTEVKEEALAALATLAAPLPGSREFVLNCVADAAGVFRPVGVDSVHLSNSAVAPSWQFAVIAAANQNLGLVQPMNGATRRARSILSWGFQPTNCAFVPIWGNAVNYRIRLDQ